MEVRWEGSGKDQQIKWVEFEFVSNTRTSLTVNQCDEIGTQCFAGWKPCSASLVNTGNRPPINRFN